MNCSSQKVGFSQRLILAVFIIIALFIGARTIVFAQVDTEREAKSTLRNLQIKPTAEPNIPVPEIYKTPPKIVEQTVGGKSEFKLFYFCKYHSSDELKQIIHEQFATKLFDKKGKETKLVDYNVSSNPATNQLIARCPTRQDAEAVLETLKNVDAPPIQVKVDCLISEIYADFTFDRETTIAIENLFGEDIAMKPGGTAFGADVQQLIADDEYLPAFPGASLRELIRARMGLKIGYLSTENKFTALVDLLESRGFLKILMNPTLEIVNGKTAVVQSTQHVPLQKITKTIPGAGSTTVVLTETEYVDVIDSLQITPHVFADGYIGLETSIMLGAKNTPDGVKQIPILTKKEIESKENRIRQGESLIIGGIRKTEKFGVVRGVPILKDIPLIGFLFSGEDTEERAVETVFILTPTISTGGIPNEEMIREVQRKHEPTQPQTLGEMITDPFGFKARDKARDLKLEQAEQVRLEAEVEKAQARVAVREANERAEKARDMMAEAEKIKAQAEAKIKAAEAAQETKENPEKPDIEAETPAVKETSLKVQKPKEGTENSQPGAAKSKAQANKA